MRCTGSPQRWQQTHPQSLNEQTHQSLDLFAKKKKKICWGKVNDTVFVHFTSI
jgi:hypothetical protein